jgi:hypothetical protein
MITVAVLVVMWLPPIIGTIRDTPGNLGAGIDYFLHPKGQTHGLLDGYRVVTAQLSTTPEWVTGAATPNPFTGEPDSVFRTAAPWLVIPFVLAAWQLRRRRVGEAVRLAAIVGGAACLAIIAVDRTIGPILAYRLRWIWLLAMLAMVVVAWAVWNTAPRLKGRYAHRLLVAPVAAGILALTVTSAVNAARAATPERPESATLARLVPPLVKALPKRAGAVIVDSPSFGGAIYATGMIVWLERLGIAVQVPNGPDSAERFGIPHVHYRGPVRVIVNVADASDYDRLAGDPGERLVSARGHSSRTERAMLSAQIATLQAQYRAGTISSRELLDRSALPTRELGTVVGVFVRNP